MDNFAYFFIKTYGVCAHARRLMSTHNISFYEEMAKIIYQLSSNMHLISSSVSSQVSVLNWGCNVACFSGQLFSFLFK